MLSTRGLFQIKDTNRLRLKGQKNILYANSKQKRTGVAIPILDKIGCKGKWGTRDKDSKQ